MLTVAFVMLAILALAGLVVLYVAFPHRGEEIPAVPWVGDAMRKGLRPADHRRDRRGLPPPLRPAR